MANSATKITTGKVRFSYANVFTPRAFQPGQEPDYSVTLLIPKKDKPAVAKIRAAIAAATENGLTDKWHGKKPAKFWNPLRDGDEERADEHPEYAGMYFLNTKSRQKPLVIDRDKEEILDTTEFYSGCWGRANVTFAAFSNSGNNGIGCYLNAVQKLKDDTPFSGNTTTADDFDDDFEDDEDEEDLI